MPAYGQTPPTSTRPVLDDNGVDLATGKVETRSKSISVGDLAFANVWNGSVNETSFTNVAFSNGFQAVVFVDGRSLRFLPDQNGVFQPELANGATLTPDAIGGFVYTAPSGARYDFVKSPNGTVTSLQSSIGSAGSWARLAKITLPNGETRTWNYRTAEVSTGCEPVGPFGLIGPDCTTATYQRPQSVITNTGLMLKANYASQTPGADFNKLASVTAINLSVEYCDPQADACSGLTQAWPTLAIAQTTDNTGLVETTFTNFDAAFLARIGANGPTQISDDGAGNPNRSYTFYPDGKLYQIVKSDGTDTYTYAQSGDQLTVTRTGPNNVVNTYVVSMAGSRLDAKTDELGRTTSYGYDSQNRLYKTIFPEGDEIVLTHDPLGRVVETRRKAKPGSPLADVVTSAGYETNCTVETLASCMKPLWTIDARGARTDYSYGAASADILKVQLPAATAGAPRAEVSYGYTPLYAKVRDAGGALVDAASPVWKLTSVNRCAVAVSCTGAAQETRTTIAYGASGGGLNLLPTQIVTASGDGAISSSVGYGYDVSDNVVSVDGPRPGGDDTTHYLWDTNKRLIGAISADPDGAGALPRLAVRHAYVGDRLTRTENGTATGTDAAALAAMTVTQATDTTFDANDYRIKDVVSAGGATFGVVQYGYDADGRLECTALRMNTATWGALPASACTLGTTGAAGPDRITRTTYDAAGQVTRVTSAYGTADQSDDATVTYSANGLAATRTDAANNRTSYAYDGFDRLAKTSYPVATVGAGMSSTTDYEQLTYDAGGNVTVRRLRDGRQIAFAYDALSRATSKVIPEGCAPLQVGSCAPARVTRDVYYTYDLAGRLTAARFDAITGEGLSFAWDALGRQASATTGMGGGGRTLSYGYDAAGDRNRITHPDGVYFTTLYDGLGRMRNAEWHAPATGTVPFMAIAYDALGRRGDINRASSHTGYNYDGVSRLIDQDQRFAGGVGNTTSHFGYNPAGQIASWTRDNDGYAFTGRVNAARTYTTNGLNQHMAAGSATLSYDTNGNLIFDGTLTYAYDAENRLISSKQGSIIKATLAYDPLGRLWQVNGGASGITRMLYDGDALVGEYDGANTLLRRYFHGPGVDEPILSDEGASLNCTGTRVLHTDERGSVVAMADCEGNHTGVNTYDEYGVPGGGNTGRFQYTGQIWLPELGLYYYKARMYAPHLGRFMQSDPIGYADGMNWYNYVGGDPVNGTDPTGLIDGDDASDIVITGRLQNNDSIYTGFGSSAGFLYGFTNPSRYGQTQQITAEVFEDTGPDIVVQAVAKPKVKPKVGNQPQNERQACNQRVRFANTLLSWADGADANGDTAINAGAVAAGGAVLLAATGVGAPGGGLLGTFALGSFTAGTFAKGGASLVRLAGHTVGSLATGNQTAFQNAFMNGVLAGATSGRGGPAGSIAEGAMGDAAKQPVPNSYSCPR